jgi:hypothetical protein
MSGSNLFICAVVSTSASRKKHTRDVRRTGAEPVLTIVDVTVSCAVYGLPAGAASTFVTSRCLSPSGPAAVPPRLVTEPARVAAGDDAPGGPLQHDAGVGDQEDAGELVGDHDDRHPEIAAEQGD